MSVLTLELDVFFVYLAMKPGRSIQALSERLGIPEEELRRRAERERWEERAAGLERELDLMPPAELDHAIEQIGLGRVVEVRTRLGAIPGFVGFVATGTNLLVQLQRRGGAGQ